MSRPQRQRFVKPAPRTPVQALRAYWEHELCQLRAKERVNGMNVTKERAAVLVALASLK